MIELFQVKYPLCNGESAERLMCSDWFYDQWPWSPPDRSLSNIATGLTNGIRLVSSSTYVLGTATTSPSGVFRERIPSDISSSD
jgi:hypothetical protein